MDNRYFKQGIDYGIPGFFVVIQKLHPLRCIFIYNAIAFNQLLNNNQSADSEAYFFIRPNGEFEYVYKTHRPDSIIAIALRIIASHRYGIE